MSDATALKMAIDLMLIPSRVRLAKASPLPDGVPFLLQVATSDEEAMREAVELTGKPRETLQGAAIFFIEQILLRPGADSYHILGARPDASAAQLRQNLALLLRWLHPDVSENAQSSIFITRITSAWDDLKTPDRRIAYDMRRNGCGAGPDSRRDAWPADMSAIPEYRNVDLYENVTAKMAMDAPAQSGGVRQRSGDSFLHRVLMLLMGELGD